MATPDDLERQHTLLTATARYEELRTCDALAPRTGIDAGSDAGGAGGGDAGVPPPLTREEVLEMLALSEVIARKAGYGRQLGVRSARAAGASWSQIGAALGTSKQSAWEAYARWVEDQAEQYRRSGYSGFDDPTAAAARVLAAGPEDQVTG